MMKRIWHPWTEWECFHGGMFNGRIGLDKASAERAYSDFLRDTPRFEKALARVLAEWPKSCEQFLSNVSNNRLAWLGQAAACIDAGLPCIYRNGFSQMSNEDRDKANATAMKFLKIWEANNARKNSQIREDMEGKGLF